jgi:hypothetical protein
MLWRVIYDSTVEIIFIPEFWYFHSGLHRYIRLSSSLDLKEMAWWKQRIRPTKRPSQPPKGGKLCQYANMVDFVLFSYSKVYLWKIFMLEGWYVEDVLHFSFFSWWKVKFANIYFPFVIIGPCNLALVTTAIKRVISGTVNPISANNLLYSKEYTHLIQLPDQRSPRFLG